MSALNEVCLDRGCIVYGALTMLCVCSPDTVRNPVEAKKNVEDDRDVVDPGVFTEYQRLAKTHSLEITE